MIHLPIRYQSNFLRNKQHVASLTKIANKRFFADPDLFCILQAGLRIQPELEFYALSGIFPNCWFSTKMSIIAQHYR
jgi:hypothetical protein